MLPLTQYQYSTLTIRTCSWPVTKTQKLCLCLQSDVLCLFFHGSGTIKLLKTIRMCESNAASVLFEIAKKRKKMNLRTKSGNFMVVKYQVF